MKTSLCVVIPTVFNKTSWDKYQSIEKVQWSFTPRPRARRLKPFSIAALECWETRKWPDSVQIVMSRSEQRVTLLYPAAIPIDSVYRDVPFVCPWFGYVLCPVAVRSVNSECWVDICANIWVESADLCACTFCSRCTNILYGCFNDNVIADHRMTEWYCISCISWLECQFYRTACTC